MPDSETGDKVIVDYLIRVGNAARHLPRAVRDRIVADATEQIYAELGDEPYSPQDVARVLAEMGDPRDVVRSADHVIPGTGNSWLEFTTIIVLLVGGIVWIGLWAVGVVLLWVSPRWRWQDKLLGTLVWPGGLLAARVIQTRFQFMTFANPTIGHSTWDYLIQGIVGRPYWHHFAELAVAGVPPILVAIWLLRRARPPLAGGAAGATSRAGGTGLT